MKDMVKYSSQMEKALLAQVKSISEAQGRKLQEVIEEALRDYVERVKQGKPRAHVVEACMESMMKHSDLYRKLAQ